MMAAPTQSKVILHADGHRLAGRWVRPAGDTAQGPTLVFLHEGLGCIGLWGDFPDAVVAATGLPALVYDRYGYGASDPLDGAFPPDWMEHEALVALPQILIEAGIESPLLIGHSDGGSIALIHGAHHPCAGIVTEAAHIYQDDLTHSGQAHVRGQLDRGVLQEHLTPYHGARTEALVEAWLAHWADPRQADWNITGLLPRITCLLLAIQGDRDRFGEPAQLDGIVAGVSGPAGRLFVSDCGHVPHHQAREVVLAAVTDFIDGVASAPSAESPA
jgi:pimeloyl-ACP methyl ester carboxylesterase